MISVDNSLDRADPLGDLAEFRPAPTAPIAVTRENPRRLRNGGLSLAGAPALADGPQHSI